MFKRGRSMDMIRRTIELARANVERGGRPLAYIIARDGEVIAEAVNLVAQPHDPTAHAEICAIR
jgi:guanine deaminase